MANDIKLQEGKTPIDSNLRPLKVGGRSSSLELADTDNGARVRGDLEITGNTYADIEKMYLGDIPAYSGMVLGYTVLGESSTHESYTLTTSYVVPDGKMTVVFIAPPSGNVEIMVQVYVDGSSNRAISFGLSDNSTYNSLGNSYQQLTAMVDESDQHVHQHFWTKTGLTAGTSYQYWLGATANGGTLLWGGTATGRYCDFIMKATALPPTSGYTTYA